MKQQDTQIILGLKDIISNLTMALQQKENNYQDINDKYVFFCLHRISLLKVNSKR